MKVCLDTIEKLKNYFYCSEVMESDGKRSVKINRLKKFDDDSALTIPAYADGDIQIYLPNACVGLFQNSRFTEININVLDTSNVVSMKKMFLECENLQTLDISGFDTSNVIDMESVFDGCNSLENLDVSGFNTGNVADMSSMFSGCKFLKSIDVSGFDTSNVIDMNCMFSGCGSLEKLDVSGFNTANVVDMTAMFNGCRLLDNVDVSGFDTSKATSTVWMFGLCRRLKAIDLSSFNTSNVTCMKYMFCLCTSLKTIDLSNFIISDEIDNYDFCFGDMITDCDCLETIVFPVIGQVTRYLIDEHNNKIDLTDDFEWFIKLLTGEFKDREAFLKELEEKGYKMNA